MTDPLSAGPALRPRYGGVAPSIGQYPRLSPVQAVARALGCMESTAAQALKASDERFLWGRTAAATAALMDAGHVLRARELCVPIFAALQPQPLFVTRDAVIDALTLEARTEGAENEAQAALADWSNAALHSWLIRAEREYAAQGAAIQLVRAFLGEPC